MVFRELIEYRVLGGREVISYVFVKSGFVRGLGRKLFCCSFNRDGRRGIG